MSEPQQFMCPGTYFGRYCSDEREYEYARTLERDNKEVMKLLDSIKSPEESEACIKARKASENFRKVSENISNFLKELRDKGLIKD